MKYLSIYTETTGLDSENHQILSIGVIIEDTNNKLPFHKIPKFHCVILHDEIKGEPYAISMNIELIKLILEYKNKEDEVDKQKMSGLYEIRFLTQKEVCAELWAFLMENSFFEEIQQMHNSFVQNVSTINVAGKNFGVFDKLFLEKLPRWHEFFKIKNRIIDPSVLFTDWNKDESLPSLDECKERAKIDGNVSHNAINDAWDVIQLMRNQY